MLESFTTWY